MVFILSAIVTNPSALWIVGCRTVAAVYHHTDSPSQIVALPSPRLEVPPAVHAREMAAASRAVPAVDVDLFAPLREAVALLGAQCVPVLVSAMLGYAGAAAVTQSLGLFAQTSLDTDMWPLVALAVIGLPLHALAQGAIAWVGLRGEGASTMLPWGVPLRAALCAALKNWRALLPIALTRVLLTFGCALACTGLLVTSGLRVDAEGPAYPNPDGMPRLVARRGIEVAVLGPEHPLAGLLTPARQAWHQFTLQHSAPALAPAGLKWLAYGLNTPNSD